MLCLGWTEEVTVCDCCGKQDLSGTNAFEAEDGSIVYYGSVCSGRNLGRKKFKTEANNELAKRWHLYWADKSKAPEAIAYNARCDEAHRLKITPGKEFAAYVHDAAEAWHVADAALKAKHRLDGSWKRKSA